MSAQSSHRSLSRLLTTAAAALLLTAGGILVATPAQAHDELISSDPATGATVDAMPAELTLTFSGEISPEPGATELSVTDAAGTSLAAGEPVIQDNVVTLQLEGEASGAVTVLWKVVSSDGHPISDELSFTVTAAPAPEPTLTPEPTETAEPTPTPTAEPTETTAPVLPPSDEASSSGAIWPWVIGGVLLAAVGGAVVYLLVSRARRAKDLAEATAASRASDASSPPTADQ